MNEDVQNSLDELMARLAEGDRSAFRLVFDALWGPLLRLCSSLLNNKADAEDAAQLALEKILTRASDYDAKRPALPWALAIGTWECRTLLRRRFRRRETFDEGPGAIVADRFDDDHHAEAELLRAALSALETLSERDQETLRATYWEEEASASGATLRKRRERALGRLRESFRRLYGLG